MSLVASSLALRQWRIIHVIFDHSQQKKNGQKNTHTQIAVMDISMRKTNQEQSKSK